MRDANADRYVIPVFAALFATLVAFLIGTFLVWQMTVLLCVYIPVLCGYLVRRGWRTVNAARAKYYSRKEALVNAFGKSLAELPEWFATIMCGNVEMLTVSGVSYLNLPTLHGRYVVRLASREEDVENVLRWRSFRKGTTLSLLLQWSTQAPRTRLLSRNVTW